MARDTAGPGDGKRTVNGGGDESSRATGERFGRRSYLKLAGSVAAAAGLSAAASARSGEYDVIETRGQVIRLGDETWENKLIDCRNGDGITIVVEGAATIRNVGLKGLYRGGSFVFSITNTGGTVTFDTVYLGDGANKAGESFVHGPGAIFYHRSADCRVEFDRTNVQGFPNNGFYCSNTAYGGSVHWTNCFGKNNGVSTFRCAGRDDSLENCVAYNDGTDYSTDNGAWGDFSESHGRPLWVWSPGTANVRDCRFAAGSYPAAVLTHDGGSVTLEGGAISGGTSGDVRTNGVGSDPDLSIPDGVPTSAEEAASGGAASGGTSGSTSAPWTEEYGVEHIYEVENTGDEPVDYYLQVSDGGFERLAYDGAVVDEDLTWAGDDKAAGRVAPGDTHCWGLNDLLVDVTVEDAANAAARVDGAASSLGWYPRPGADGDEWKDIDALLARSEPLEHALLIDGVGTLRETTYEFRASGRVEPSTHGGASIDADTAIDGGRASGSLRGWRDAFEFGGDLESLTIDGPARVYLDGERVDPGEYGAAFDHVLTIVGNGSPASYEVRVDGRIASIAGDDSSRYASVESGRTATGTIERDYQRFRYSGSVTELAFDEGTAFVYADRDRITPDDF